MSVCFTEDDLPGSYQDADCASLTAQRRYIRVFRIMLISSVVAAAFTWAASAIPIYRIFLNSLSLILAVSAFVSTFILKERKYEDTWYLGRAVAESIKTRTWRYMTGASPYVLINSQQTVDEQFIADVRRILSDNSSLILERAKGKSRDEISNTMRAIRSLALEGRLQTYLECRIIDQRDWYAKKATDNASNESRLFVFVLLCQFAASVIAFYGIVTKSVIGDSAGVLAAAGTAFVAWLQVKKYQETAKAYSVASHELSMAAALVNNVTDELQISTFVEDTESAISREHILWRARRTV